MQAGLKLGLSAPKQDRCGAVTYLNDPDGRAKSGLNLSKVNDAGDSDDFEHAVPVVGLAELVVTLVAPRVRPGSPTVKICFFLTLIVFDKNLGLFLFVFSIQLTINV